MAKGDRYTLDELMARDRAYNLEHPEEVAQEIESAVEEPEKTGAFPESIQPTANIAGGILRGFSAPGRTMQNIISKGVDKATGGRLKLGTSKKEGFERLTRTDLDTTQAKIGEMIGEGAHFALTSGATGAAVKGAPLMYRALAQGGTSAATEAMLSGDIDKGEVIAFFTGAGAEVAGTIINNSLKWAGDKLPEWFVRPLAKQSATAKAQGKDITPFFVESGYKGSVDDIIRQSDEAMFGIVDDAGKVTQKGLNGQIDDIIANSDETLNLHQIADDIAKKYNTVDNVITGDDVLEVVSNQSLKARGAINKAIANPADDISLALANQTRSNLDETLYSGRDYLRQVLPENKEILEEFTNAVRIQVQSKAPQTKPLFQQFANNITLKKAVESAAAASQGRNTLSMMDIVMAVGGFAGSGGNVGGSVAAVAGRRAFETPQVKTGLAQLFAKNAPRVSNFLSTASPATRAAVLELVTSLTRDKQSNKE